ncbi:MAG: 6-bladed beta-propeller [Mangrovibacterium sp.]
MDMMKTLIFKIHFYPFNNCHLKILMACCLIVLTACSQREMISSIETIDINQIPQKSIKIQEITSGFTIVPLETKKESLIQYIKKVVLYDNKFFILDSQRPLLAVFSIEGKYIRSIGKKGNGPGEFYYPTDFLIDLEQKQIELYDGFRDRILIYDLEGNFKKRIQIPVQGDYFVKFYDGTYLIYTNMRNNKEQPFKLFRIKEAGKILSRELAYTTKTIQTVCSPFVQIANNEYIFSEHSCDTIFRVTAENISPLINIDMGKEGLPFEYRLDIMSINNMGQRYSLKWGSPIAVDNSVIIKYMNKSNSKYLIFNRSTNKATYYQIQNNYDFAFGTPDFVSNNKLIGMIHPLSMNLHKKDPQFELAYRVGEKIPEIEELRKNLKITDNPCLVLWDINLSEK